jgi:dihydrofolate synthase/folylpolyglutamate synthase
MSYQHAVTYLLQLGRELAAPRQPRVQKFDLENIRTLAAFLGHPERRFPVAHIAGTNGKGSTAAMLESILRTAGLRTGLYTSPHLERINERIALNGEPVDDRVFAAAFDRIHQAIETLLARGELAAHPTFFECLTAIAFSIFADARLDAAVVEVGMGGRLDATNIVQPSVCIVTEIDFDHEAYLGHSIEAIAGEKAGIIKPGVPVVVAASRPEARAVIFERAAIVGAPVVDLDAAYRLEPRGQQWGCYSAEAVEIETGERLLLAPALAGRWQLRNALAAAAAARVLARQGWPVSAEHIATGIARARWPARLERIGQRPLVYVDGTHNTAGARELARFWDEHLAGRRILLIFAALRDKPVDEMAGLLFPRAARVLLTQPAQPRALTVETLAELTAHLAPACELIPDPADALRRALALAGPEDVVFVTGSLYLAGQLRQQARALCGGG